VWQVGKGLACGVEPERTDAGEALVKAVGEVEAVVLIRRINEEGGVMLPQR
jgi:hypothetical protein